MATFKEAIILGVQEKYATFQGRASRSEYWYFILFVILANIGAGILDSVVFGTVGGLFYVIVAFGLLVPNLSVATRRLHDVGRSGWWILLSIIPIIGLALIYFFARKSDEGSNQYGEPSAY